MKKIIVLSLLLSLFSFVTSHAMYSSKLLHQDIMTGKFGSAHSAIILTDVTHVDHENQTPLHMILVTKRIRKAKNKKAQDEKRKKLFYAILTDIKNKEKYSEKIKYKFLNQLSNRKKSALHLAIDKGYIDLAIQLIKAGADVTIKNDGKTVLFQTLLKYKKEMSKYNKVTRWRVRPKIIKELKALLITILEDINNIEKYSENQKYNFLSKLNDMQKSALRLVITQKYVNFAIDLIRAGADITIPCCKKTVWDLVLESENIKVSDKQRLINKMIEDLQNTKKYKELHLQDYKTKIKQALEKLRSINLELPDLNERILLLRKEEEKTKNFTVSSQGKTLQLQKTFMLL